MYSVGWLVTLCLVQTDGLYMVLLCRLGTICTKAAAGSGTA